MRNKQNIMIVLRYPKPVLVCPHRTNARKHPHQHRSHPSHHVKVQAQWQRTLHISFKGHQLSRRKRKPDPKLLHRVGFCIIGGEKNGNEILDSKVGSSFPPLWDLGFLSRSTLQSREYARPGRVTAESESSTRAGDRFPPRGGTSKTPRRVLHITIPCLSGARVAQKKGSSVNAAEGGRALFGTRSRETRPWLAEKGRKGG